jgi:hypothetical protein
VGLKEKEVKMLEEGRRIVAHERAIELLEEDPIRYFDTLAELYKSGAIVPRKYIDRLKAAFIDAEKAIRAADEETILGILTGLRGQKNKRRQKK